MSEWGRLQDSLHDHFDQQGVTGVDVDKLIEHLVNVRDFFPGLFPATRTAPAAEPLDVERLTTAMDFDRVEALSIIEKHGFVFTTDLSKPIENRTGAERWEALAFRLYTMLLPSNRRSERIIAEYARLRSPEGD